MALVYRERGALTSNFFVDLDYSHRTIAFVLSEPGLGSSRTMDGLAELGILHFALGPELSLGRTSLRFGPQFGWIISSETAGVTSSSFGIGSPQQHASNDLRLRFKGDMRFALAFRVDVLAKSKWKLVLDPYANLGLNSLVYGETFKLKATDIGLRVGLYRIFQGRGFWRTLRAGSSTVKPPTSSQ